MEGEGGKSAEWKEYGERKRDKTKRGMERVGRERESGDGERAGKRERGTERVGKEREGKRESGGRRREKEEEGERGGGTER